MADVIAHLVPEWVENTLPSPSGTNISTLTSVRIAFAKSLDTTLLSNNNFELYLDNVAVSGDVFETINPAMHYNSISRTLYIKPTDDLSANSVYTIYIKDLYDAAGQVQTDDHYWSFTTGAGSTGTVIEDFPVVDVDVLIVEDYAPQYPSIPTYIPSNLTSSPYNGQIGVASGSASGIITINFGGVIDTSLISVRAEDWGTIGSYTEKLDIVVTQVTTGATSGTVSIQLPQQPSGSGVYFKENTAYYVDAIFTTIVFTGVLTPLYFSPNLLSGFLGYELDEIEAAKTAFLTSLEIQAITSFQLEDYTGVQRDPNSIMQLALYMALVGVTSRTENEDFQLGQLRITNRVAIGVNNPYSQSLRYWWKKVFGGFSPKQVLTIDRESNDYLRSFNRTTYSLPYKYTGRNPKSWL